MNITYSHPRLVDVIDDWPIGFRKKAKAVFGIETKGGKQRGTRYTIDGTTGRASALKTLTYARKARIVDGSDGKTYIVELSDSTGMSLLCRAT